MTSLTLCYDDSSSTDPSSIPPSPEFSSDDIFLQELSLAAAGPSESATRPRRRFSTLLDPETESQVFRGMISGKRGDQYPGNEGINIRGTRVSISGKRGDQYPGYEGVNIRKTSGSISGVRGCQYPGYEGINIRGTMVLISGV